MLRPHNILAVNNVTTIRVQMRSAQMVVGFTLIGVFFHADFRRSIRFF